MISIRSRLPLLFCVCLCLASVGRAQWSGAIRTTDAQAGPARAFESQRDVFLAGEGLPDGEYLFQVTDPSGAVLLSADPVASRRLTVVGGAIAATPALGGHALRRAPDGSKLVALQPFRTSPSGQYKVWLTPAASFVPGGKSFGFSASASKTYNYLLLTGKYFKPCVVQGTVFYDIDNNGVFDPAVVDEVPVPGWRVQLTSGGVTEVTYADVDGHYEFVRAAYSLDHHLESIAPAPGYVGIPGGRWRPTTPTEVLGLQATPDEVTVDFGILFMIYTPELGLGKGYWHGANGKANLEVVDPLWRGTLNGLCLRLNSTVPYPPPDPDPTIFLVSETAAFEDAFAQLSQFLVANDFGILANTLAKHYAAAQLNTVGGALDGKIVSIDQLGDDVLVDLGTMAANTLALLCDPRSCDTGPDGDPVWRAKVMGCLQEWSGMGSGDNLFTSDRQAPAFGSGY